jgi:hypothetical protein
MTYTHITYDKGGPSWYEPGEEFLFDHGAIDNGDVCRGYLIAMKLNNQWERVTPVHFTLKTGDRSCGEGVRTAEEVLMQPLDSLPQAERAPQMYGFDYVVGQLPETIELRSVVRDLAPEEDMPANAIIFSAPSVQSSGDYVSGTVVGVQTNIGWQIIDPYASGLFRATNAKCELEPGIGEDVYDVVRNLNAETLSLSDVDQLTTPDLTL